MVDNNKVPEAILSRIAEIDENIHRARNQQQHARVHLERLDALRARIKTTINARRRGIRGWELQVKMLRFAVDAIEGRVIDVLGVAAEPLVVRTEPFRPKLSYDDDDDHAPKAQEASASPPPTGTTKNVVYETMVRIGRSCTSKDISAEASLESRQIAPMLGLLRKEGKIERDAEGRWEVLR